MNYFAHARPFLDRPYFAAGTGVPDWLTVCDRKVRLRRRHVIPWLGDPDACLAELAGGIRQHLCDDRRFHGSRAFGELQWELTARVRDVLAGDTGLRPSFLGHLLVELLLDAALVAEDPAGLEEYFRVLESVDPQRVQGLVNRMAPRPTGRLGAMIAEFRRLRILSDYLEDGKLLGRLNQVMQRVRLAPLPNDFVRLLPDARRMVAGRKAELLEGIPTEPDSA